MIIYLIRCNINARFYIGKTTRTLNQRWLEHLRDARNGHKRGEFYADIREYGPDAFTVNELATAYSQRRLNQMERKYIRLHRADIEGYNQAAAAFGGKPRRKPLVPRVLSSEHRARIAETVRAHHAARKAAREAES